MEPSASLAGLGRPQVQETLSRDPRTRIRCLGEDLMSSPGGVVLVIFSALGNWVSSRRLKSSRLSYSFPR